MKASEEVVRRTFSLRNCDLNDVVGYRQFGTFSDLKSFLVSFSDRNHNIGDWSGVCEVGREIDACLRVKSFPNFQFEGVWSTESELSSADRSLCLPSGFLSTIPLVRG